MIGKQVYSTRHQFSHVKWTSEQIRDGLAFCIYEHGAANAIVLQQHQLHLMGLHKTRPVNDQSQIEEELAFP